MNWLHWFYCYLLLYSLSLKCNSVVSFYTTEYYETLLSLLEFILFLKGLFKVWNEHIIVFFRVKYLLISQTLMKKMKMRTAVKRKMKKRIAMKRKMRRKRKIQTVMTLVCLSIWDLDFSKRNKIIGPNKIILLIKILIFEALTYYGNTLNVEVSQTP